MPEATVAAIITDPETGGERILLTRRSCEPFAHLWCLPGGHINPGELARDAIVREVKEETGLDLDPKFFGYFDEIIPTHSIHAVVLVFTGHGWGTPTSQSEEVSDIAWFTLGEARAMDLAFRHSHVLESYSLG